MHQVKLKQFCEDLKHSLQGLANFQELSLLQKIYSFTLVLFLIAALPIESYEFYISLRTLVCIGIIVFLSSLFAKTSVYHKCALVGFIALYNPLFPIHLDSKVLWTLVNIGTLYFLFILKEQSK